ncbi:MAG: HTTM domain-containing protein [Bacteroidia bacterium]
MSVTRAAPRDRGHELRYLRPNQERMMSTQPDLILQFAHFLEKEYQRQGIPDPEVYADVRATLNGSGSRPFIDPSIDLTTRREGFAPKDWILPFSQEHPNFSQSSR